MKLYDYQVKVAQILQSGQSVILQAPTGSGKTIAALWPFLEAWDRNNPLAFPRKCIYSVPMRVLATQFSYEINTLLKEKFIFAQNPIVTIQTGDQPEDPKLEGDLIFTTIDQTLSNFLAIPYSLSNRLANLNAGAVASSYLVFDEFHLFPPEAMETTLAMLQMLKGLSPFLLMTATFSSKMLDELSERLGAVVVPQDEPMRLSLQSLPSQQKTRYYQTVDSCINADNLMAHHQKRTIAICNQVDRARALYDEVMAHPDLSPDTPVILLHSRFYQTDRQAKEDNLRHDFGKDKKGKAILIATQVVEVGLDITCEALHTELAPANAILQRAGRCARYEGEVGQVYVYRLPENDEGKVQYAPYHQKGQPEICEETWRVFKEYDGLCLTFADEQRLLSKVHSTADALLLQKLANNHSTHVDMMAMAISGQERGLVRDLIREVNNRNILIHPDPNGDVDEKEDWRLKSPFRWESFGLFRYSVDKIWQQCEQLALQHEHDEWVMMRLDVAEEEGDSYGKPRKWGEERGKLRYKWTKITDKSQIDGTLLIALNPRFATYDKQRGLELAVFNEGDFPTQTRPYNAKPDDEPYTYQQETYQEHITGLYRAYQDKDHSKNKQPLQAEMAYIFAKLEQHPFFNLPPNTLDKIARYIIAAHDLGKLGQKWQTWVHRWQDEIGQEVAATMMLAHTDNDRGETHQKVERQLKRELGSRPPHAAESAYSLLPVTGLFLQNLGVSGEAKMNLMCALNKAITCHHSATHSGEVQSFKISPHGEKALVEAFNLVGFTELDLSKARWAFEEDSLSKYLVNPDKLIKQTLPYFLLVRLLRLADQRSLQ